MDNLRVALTMQQVADMGVVHRGRMGYTDCSVAVSIGTAGAVYFVCITVIHQKARAGRIVQASVGRWRGQTELTLSSARRGGAAVVAQFPLDACANIRAALAAYTS